MNTLAKLVLAAILLVGFVAAASAGDEKTLTGKVMCAHCTLKKADVTKCQDVLVVEDGQKTTEYYVEKNAVAEKFGHACSGAKPAIWAPMPSSAAACRWPTARPSARSMRRPMLPKRADPMSPSPFSEMARPISVRRWRR